MRARHFTWLGGLAIAALGCTSSVNGGGTGGGGQGGGGQGGQENTGGAGGCGGPGCGVVPAPSGAAQAVEGGLVVQLGDYPITCAGGIMPGCSAETWWSIEFELPDVALVPGTVHSLADLDGWSTVTLPGSGDDCTFGAGTFHDGTIEVVAVTDDLLTVAVSGTTPSMIGLSVDGTYEVPICPAAPPPPDGAAISMLHAEMGGGSGSTGSGSTSVGTTGGPFIDPDTLMIFLSNGPQSCAEPWALGDGCVAPRYQITIQLAPELQVPGTLPLAEIATYSESEGSIGLPGECSGGGGSYWEGSIQILSIDGEQITFTLSGTADLFVVPGNADGTYTAPRCF